MTKFIVSFAYTDDSGELGLDNVCFFDTYQEARSYMNRRISDNFDLYDNPHLEMDKWQYELIGEGYAREIMTIEKVEM